MRPIILSLIIMLSFIIILSLINLPGFHFLCVFTLSRFSAKLMVLGKMAFQGAQISELNVSLTIIEYGTMIPMTDQLRSMLLNLFLLMTFLLRNHGLIPLTHK
jgi:hypothetical protein